MSINRHKPHLLVLPEDDANREIANGFQLLVPKTGAILTRASAGGWRSVVEQFKNREKKEMDKYPYRYVLLIIDFDNNHPQRLEEIREDIPEEISARVFVLGCKTEAETLKRDTKLDFEEIGKSLAKDCNDRTEEMWNQPQLQVNSEELTRLKQKVRPFLFEP